MARFCLLLAALCWAGNLLVGRIAAAAFDAASLNLARWGIAASVLLPLALPELWRERATLLREWRVLVALAFTGAAGFHTLQYAALARTETVNVALYIATVPLLVLLLSRLNGGRLTRRQWIGASASVLGAVVVVTRGELDRLLALSFAAGDLLEILAVPLWAGYCVLLARRPPELSGIALLAVIALLGTVLTLPFFLLLETRIVPGPLALASTLYVGLFPSLLAYLCWNAGSAALGAGRAAPYNNLVPIFGALFGMLLLGEPLHGYHLAASALVAVGILTAESGRPFPPSAGAESQLTVAPGLAGTGKDHRSCRTAPENACRYPPREAISCGAARDRRGG